MTKSYHVLLNTAQLVACRISLQAIILEKAALKLQPACYNEYTTDVITCSGYFFFLNAKSLSQIFKSTPWIFINRDYWLLILYGHEFLKLANTEAQKMRMFLCFGVANWALHAHIVEDDRVEHV
jgi:hypothetical protein